VLTLLDFSDWLHEIVKSEMVVRHARQSSQLGAKNKEVKKDHPKVLSVTTSGSEALKSPVKTEKTHGKCPLCREDHRLGVCKTFTAKDKEERMNIVRTLGVCIRCLNRGHVGRDCESRMRCNVNKCGGRHHALLHGVSI